MSFNSRALGKVVAVDLVILVALAFAVVSYVQWSSDAAWSEFMSAANVSASDTDHSIEPPAADQSDNGATGCPVGKRKLPTQVRPLP